VGVIAWVGVIAAGIIGTIATLYITNYLDFLLPGDPTLAIASADVVEGVDPTGARTPDATPCGTFGQPSCDFGDLVIVINNQGGGNAESCTFTGKQVYDITGARQGRILHPDLERHQEHRIGEDVPAFDIPERTNYTLKVPVSFPYLGDYTFSEGKITCGKGNDLTIDSMSKSMRN
jgi:hypothetical protein